MECRFDKNYPEVYINGSTEERCPEKKLRVK